MNPCQIIDLVDMDNPWHLRVWRRLEMQAAPFVEDMDRRLPRGLVRRRKQTVRRFKAWLGKRVKPDQAGTPTAGRAHAGVAGSGAGSSSPAQPGGNGAATKGGTRDGRARATGGEGRLQPGDWVRVKSLEAVQQTLNRRGMCGGLRFMPVQHAYCGKTFRVFKQVNTFLDERDFRMKRLRDVVILEGVYCDGSPLEPVPCDRSCFLFWKEAWLEKVDGPA